MSTMRRLSLTALGLTMAAAFGAALTGCADDPREGYSFATTHRTDVTSIAVPMFNNLSQDFALEQELTAAVVSEVKKQTPYKLVSIDAAQTILTGTITEARLRKLSTARDTGLAETVAVELVVDFTWKNTRTGKVLTSRRNFTTSESFTASKGIGERIEVGQNASISRMAANIVAEMRSGW